MTGIEKEMSDRHARLRALESNDPWQGVRLTGTAKMLPMSGGVQPWSLPLEFKADCDICYWAAVEVKMPGDQFTTGFGSTDLLRVQSWPAFHMTDDQHKRAWLYFVENQEDYFPLV